MKAFLILLTFLCLATPCFSIKDSDLAKLQGYCVYQVTTVNGDFEGADFGKLVTLQNGMVFQFNEYHYQYAFQPTAVIFSDGTHVMLLIDDYLYEAVRIQ